MTFTGFREACELAYAELEGVCLNNSSDPKRFRQVRSHSFSGCAWPDFQLDIQLRGLVLAAL